MAHKKKAKKHTVVIPLNECEYTFNIEDLSSVLVEDIIKSAVGKAVIAS